MAYRTVLDGALVVIGSLRDDSLPVVALYIFHLFSPDFFLCKVVERVEQQQHTPDGWGAYSILFIL